MSQYLHLFAGFGIEAEYMIVDATTLDIRNEAEYILRSQNNDQLENEIEVGPTCWSNELVSHVIEIKSNGPQKDIENMDITFHAAIKQINIILQKKNCKLLPTSIHPWMDPFKDTQLWPYGQKEIYKQYHSIFNCQGHGWSNLQSVHINLPFANEEEFGRLHAAIRILLPIIPFCAASSPAYENKLQERPDNRLLFYEKNQSKVSSITGLVVPEQLYDYASYHCMLQNIYKEISPYDPHKILQHSWLNSRGAIVKFDVQAIEIRIMDIQESPYMDFCLINFFVAILKNLVEENWSTYQQQKALTTEILKEVYDSANFYSPILKSTEYMEIFSLSASSQMTWIDFINALYNIIKNQIPAKFHAGLEILMQQGPLAQRMKKHLLQQSNLPNHSQFHHTLEKLSQNLNENSPFLLHN